MDGETTCRVVRRPCRPTISATDDGVISKARSLIGATIGGRYRVERVLGSGGMGCVVAARHAATEARVALKLVWIEDRESADRLLAEARAPAIADHPNVVKVHDVGYDSASGMRYLVQDLLEGRDLRTALNEAPGKKMPWTDAVGAMVPVMSALCAAHRGGLLHLDVKPENVFLERGRDGSVVPRLLDFGVARRIGESRPGEIAGTPAYMSPEQARGDASVGPQADVWAVGAVLYECLCGAPPFASDSVARALFAALSLDPSPLADRAPDAPRALTDVVMRALSRDPTVRHRTMAELLGDVLDATGLEAAPWFSCPRPSAPISSPPLSRPPEPPRPTERSDRPVRRRSVRAAVLVALSLGGVASFMPAEACVDHHRSSVAYRQARSDRHSSRGSGYYVSLPFWRSAEVRR